MTLDRSYIGCLGFLGIDFLKSVLMFLKAPFASADYFLKWVFLQCTDVLKTIIEFKRGFFEHFRTHNCVTCCY